MASKLYKLALWYIGKCNTKWDKRTYERELGELDRLTYMNFGKYMLFYGADAEWEKFSRYEVLDNAIQKLAKYENEKHETRNKAIDEFVERLETNVESFEGVVNGIRVDLMTEDYFHEYVWKIAEQMKEV